MKIGRSLSEPSTINHQPSTLNRRRHRSACSASVIRFGLTLFQTPANWLRSAMNTGEVGETLHVRLRQTQAVLRRITGNGIIVLERRYTC